MIIDQRTYTLAPGKTADYLKLYESEGMPIQLKHLKNMVGYFVTEVGPLNQIVHMWSYENYADREQRRAAMEADPAWAAYRQKSQQYLVSQENKILRPTSFSPIR